MVKSLGVSSNQKKYIWISLNIKYTEEIVNLFPNDKLQTLPNWKSLKTISKLMTMAESSSNI